MGFGIKLDKRGILCPDMAIILHCAVQYPCDIMKVDGCRRFRLWAAPSLHTDDREVFP